MNKKQWKCKFVGANPPNNYIPLVLASIHCESKMEKQIYKLGKVDRIPILQLVRPKSKKKKKEAEILIDNDGFKVDSVIDRKIVQSRNIWGWL